jgi:23S rRNA pseudouridine1911/1915/1917 synthase
VQVAPEWAGVRLDRYVSGVVETLSRAQARRLIDEGAVRLNQQAAKPAQVVQSGDRVSVYLPAPQPAHLLPEALPLHIVYEDDMVVVVDKAAGMVVHPAPGHISGTLVNALLARYPDMQVGGTLRPGIVHRLDQDTSGLLVVARSDEAMRLLVEQQKARQMHKAYLLVVEGRMKEPEGVIDAPIGRHPTDRKRQAIVANGREARTRYRVLEELGAYTLLEALLETGRTHQIRVHFAAQHRPVLGDPLYGPRKPRATFGLTRQFLHAARLGFVLPSSGTWREFTAPLPDDLAAALDKLRRAAR